MKVEMSMDELMSYIRALPKVERAIVHTLLTEEIPMPVPIRDGLNKARAKWLYE